MMTQTIRHSRQSLRITLRETTAGLGAFPRLLLGLALLNVVARARAAEAPLTAPLEVARLTSQFVKLDEDLRKSCDDVRDLTKTELAARRIDPETAQIIFLALRNSVATG